MESRRVSAPLGCIVRLLILPVKRSSGRARTAIDYDALHNGSSAPLKNPGDPRIHPYINKILEKSYPFAEDNLRRLRPELVTSTLIDSKDGTKWDKPFIVPAKWNPTPWHRAEGEDAAASEGPGISVPPPPPQANGARKRSGSPLAPRNRGQDSPASDEWTESEPRKDADALDMRIPRALTVRGVAEMIGLDTTVPMMNVVTQEPPKDVWTMGRLADYFESPVKETIYNCISCEVSNSPLGDLISRPKAVRETDLVDNVWKHAHGFPKPTVGKYVLMSVKDSFTDFHVDFGGSSVFYHIYEGKKVFLTIPPTEKALKMYEKWSSHESMNHTFLPDLLPDVPCTLLSLEKGDTLFIPSGWIHAVYTPIDSLVIGGNFLTRNFYANQMKIHHIEAVTGVPQLMRYPRFTTLMWASMFNYISTDQMPRDIEQDILTEVLSRKNKFKPSTQVYTTEELKGLPSLIEFLYRNVMIFMGVITTSQRPGGPKISKATVEAVKKAIIWPVSRDPLLYLKHFARWCIWKRACSDIVPGGERLPDWAQVGWTPPGFQAGSTNPDEPADAPAPPDGESSDAPRRGGLRDRSKLALTLDGSLEEFDYFPQRAVPAAIANLAGAGRSSSATPRHGKRKSDGTPAPSSKKSKSTRRNRQLTPMPADNDARKGADTQYLKLADGSIYVKKLSNLGPPRIGCESCRLKKTGCKHKEEIRARGWCDDERLTQELEPRRELEEDNYQAEDTPTKSSSRPASSVAPEPKAVDVSPAKTRVTSAPPLQKPPPQTPTQRPISKPRSSSSNVNSSSSKAGPPVGYKGRKPSCDDCKILKVTPPLQYTGPY